MIECEYYQNYQGPNLTKALMWSNDGDDKIDITEYIKTFYGGNNNWDGKLYTYGELFPRKTNQTKFYCEFTSDNNQKHWFNAIVGLQHHYFTPPIKINL